MKKIEQAKSEEIEEKVKKTPKRKDEKKLENQKEIKEETKKEEVKKTKKEAKQEEKANEAKKTTKTKTETVNEKASKETKKTEKRKIVQLTDEYIKTLENYLNNQDKEVRLMGAKEVVARLQEDDTRKEDPALTALVNKMLQDPYQPVKMLALGVLDSRQCTGNDYTVGVLQKMQSGQTGYGQDAKTATNILLKMAGKTVEKEFEVKEQPKKTEEKK